MKERKKDAETGIVGKGEVKGRRGNKVRLQGRGAECRRAWDSFGLSQVAIIINSLFLTNDRVFALPRIKGPGFAGRRMRLIFLTGAGGRAQSAARFPCGVLTVIPRIESRTFRWMVPNTLALRFRLDRALSIRLRFPLTRSGDGFSFFPSPHFLLFFFPCFFCSSFLFSFSFFFFYIPSFIFLQQLERPEYLRRQDLIVEF